MFWTNWNEQSPSIMRATLTGANVLVIIGTDIRTPNGLAIDHRAEKLYFSDATLDKIERCEYDGTRRYVSDTHIQYAYTHGVYHLYLILPSKAGISWIWEVMPVAVLPPAGGVEE